ncbi:hypothetical protein DMENIID0001_147220 [Sergentomyia squamirostris]
METSSNVASDTPLFPTAVVKIKAKDGSWHLIRALLDTGSGDSYVTERVASELGLKREKINAPIKGIGGTSAGISKYQIRLLLTPRFPSFYQLEQEALVLPTLTGFLPRKEAQKSSMKGLNLSNLMLADPNYMTPAPIDMILGASVYANIIKEGVKKSCNIMAQNTELGWVLAGTLSLNKDVNAERTSFVSMTDIDKDLREFWEMDGGSQPRQANHHCEKHFAETYERDRAGRYVVELPFKDDPSKLGESWKQAMARLINMEKKLSTNEALKTSYTNFMHEYIQLGHMSLASPLEGKFEPQLNSPYGTKAPR